MACERCEEAAQGRLCSGCADVQRHEERVGTPREVRERQQAIEDGDDDE